MTLMICIDKNDGMLFCGKRLSKDKLLRERMLKNAEGARLLVNSFTATGVVMSLPKTISSFAFIS